MIRLSRILTLLSYFGLLILLTSWITWLAPNLRYPVALVLIVLVGPLLLPLRGLLYERSYTHIWTSFLALFYFVLGVDAVAAGAPPSLLGWLQIGLSLMLFMTSLSYSRLRNREQRTAEH